MRCNMVNIIQVTDMHYGSEFQDEYFDNVIQYIKDNNPDAVIVSGDLVHKGRYKQYQKFLQQLQQFEQNTLVLEHILQNLGLLESA